MKKRVGLQRVLIVLSVAAVFLGRHIFQADRASHVQDDVVDAAGLLLVLLGFSIRIVARGQKELGSASSNRLVIDGIYSFVRNPMYLGTFFLGIGLCLSLFQTWTVAVFTGVCSLIYALQIRREERFLRGVFGEEYDSYCARVPRMLPRLQAWGDFVVELFPRRWKWVRREILGLGGVVMGMTAFQTFGDARKFGSWELWQEPLEIFLVTGVFYLLLFLASRRRS